MTRTWGIKASTLAILLLLRRELRSAWLPCRRPRSTRTWAFLTPRLMRLTEADCRVCHDSGVPDRHHLLYGTEIPEGVCNDQDEIACQDDAECQLDTCDPATNTCVNQPSVECAVNGDLDCRNDYCIRDSRAPIRACPAKR